MDLEVNSLKHSPLPRKSSKAISKPTRVSKSMQDGVGAVVMGGDYRGLGIVRSLGRHGIPVWVLTEGGHCLAATSRYACRTFPWPAGDDSHRVAFLLDLGVKHGLKGWLLFPTEEENAALVARNYESLAGQFQLTIPHWDVLRWCYDKRLTYRLAAELGVDHPWTYYPVSREELATVNCSFPVIIKPAFRKEFNRFTVAKAWRVNDRQSLLDRYDKVCALVAPDSIMVQEVIPGWGEAQFSYTALCQDGRPLASVVARRTRQYPMDFGRASTYVETIDEPGVVQPAVRFLAAIHFTGIVEVEFKRDPRDGLLKLLDVNPRVWGWHTLCGRAGVDFPYLLWLLLRGEPVPEVHGSAGVRWVRMSTDLPVALLEILRGRLSLRTYIRSLRRPIESAIASSDDILPGLLELPLLAYLFYRRVSRGKGI